MEFDRCFLNKLNLTLNMSQEKIKPYLNEIIDAWVLVLGEQYRPIINSSINNANYCFYYKLEELDYYLDYIVDVLTNYSFKNYFSYKSLEEMQNDIEVFSCLFSHNMRHKKNVDIKKSLKLFFRNKNQDFINKATLAYKNIYNILYPYYQKLYDYKEIYDKYNIQIFTYTDEEIKENVLGEILKENFPNELKVYNYKTHTYTFNKSLNLACNSYEIANYIYENGDIDFCMSGYSNFYEFKLVMVSTIRKFTCPIYANILHEIGHTFENHRDGTSNILREVINDYYTYKTYNILKDKGKIPILEENINKKFYVSYRMLFPLLIPILNKYEEKIKFYKLDGNRKLLDETFKEDNFQKILNIFDDSYQTLRKEGPNFNKDIYVGQIEKILTKI